MRAFKNLREFLQLLDAEKQLLRITDEVSLEPDLAAAGRAITQLSETSPAIHFDRIKGYNNAQVVLNVHGSWTNQALMLGMEKDAPLREQFFEFVRRYEQFPGEMEHQDSAPWQEVVVDKEVNLFDLMPLFRLNRGDGGFYIDKACIVSRDPDDWNNDDMETVGMYRLQVKGRNRLGVQLVPVHDIAIHLDHAEQQGKDLPIAIAVSNEPIISVAACMSVLYGQSKYKMAAVVQGKPYPVVRTRNGLDVPWGSEYVLEGRILARQREPEGPFGEFPGQYSGGHSYPVVEIDRVSHRKDPIYEALYLGMPWTELDYMCAVNTCAPIYVQLKKEIPEIVAVNAIFTLGFIVIVSTRAQVWRFCQGSGVARDDYAARHGLREDRDRRRRDSRPVRHETGDVGGVDEGEPGGRCNHTAESRHRPPRSGVRAAGNLSQDDHRCDHTRPARQARQLRSGTGQPATNGRMA